MRILLTGATGQLGSALCRSLFPQGTSLITASRHQLDLTRAGSFDRFFNETCPDLVINAAAYTAVDKAEDNQTLAFAINGEGAGAVARAAAARDIPIVHISTDYVFDGNKRDAWSEDDPPSPINVYGKSKLAGERAVEAENARHIILRVSWLYGPNGNNFLRTILRLAGERRVLKIVDDQFGRPTSTTDLADAIVLTATKAMKADCHWGLYHFCNSGNPVSWHGFAAKIVSLTETWRQTSPTIQPITTEEFNAPAPRPRNSVLKLGKIERVFGIKPQNWQNALATALKELRPEKIEAKAS